MKRGPLVIGALVTFAMIATIAAQEPGSDSPIPSIENGGPRGLRVLATWLRESGVEVISQDAPLTALPPDAGVVVLAAPFAAELRKEEVAALQGFVRAGGTLVYLASRTQPQPELQQWLPVGVGPIPPLVTEPGLEDVGGTTVEVTQARGLLEGAASLRLSANATLAVGLEDALPVTAHDAVWLLPQGAGEVWLAAGPDLAENARLELADNARFWAHLAGRGPVVFDEHHHRRPEQGLPANLLVAGLQLGFLSLLFAWSRARLGPARDEPATVHRSAREYVTALSTLLQNAHVEPELVAALKVELRKTLAETQGIPQGWSWAEADAELARRGDVPAGTLLAVQRERDFLALSRRVAALQARR